MLDGYKDELRAELTGILSRIDVSDGIDPTRLHAASEHAATRLIQELPRLREEVLGVPLPARHSEMAYLSAKLGRQYRDEWLKAHG